MQQIISKGMVSLTWSAPIIKKHLIFKDQLRTPESRKVPRPTCGPTFVSHHLRTFPILCSKLFQWEASPPYNTIDDENSIIKGGNIVDPIDSEDTPELSCFQTEEGVVEMKKQRSFKLQPLKWPMWLLGPSILLITGMVPTLWLPLSSVFLGPTIAGLLSLVGLDCIFNMGATLFLLMADSCARPLAHESRVPLTYKLWNLGSSLMGFLVPLLMLYASHKGFFQPHLPFISFSVLLGPYLLLLSAQALTEILTWHWRSPVWLLTPIVYEGYRVLQLMRGLRLGIEIGAPGWAVETVRGLVSWWVLVLGIQLMRVAWFAGLDLRTKHQS